MNVPKIIYWLGFIFIFSVICLSFFFVFQEKFLRDKNITSEPQLIVKNDEKFLGQSYSLTSEEIIGQEKITKNGYGVRCGEFFLYPLHLSGEKKFIENNTEVLEVEPQKIISQSDIIVSKIIKISRENQENRSFPSEKNIDEYLMQNFYEPTYLSTVRINGNELSGKFFTLDLEVSKGDSGRGIFDENFLCKGMLIGFLPLQKKAVFIDISRLNLENL